MQRADLHSAVVVAAAASATVPGRAILGRMIDGAPKKKLRQRAEGQRWGWDQEEEEEDEEEEDGAHRSWRRSSKNDITHSDTRSKRQRAQIEK